MGKKEISVTVQEDSYCEEDIEVAAFIELINKAIEKSATHVRVFSDYDSSGAWVRFLYRRMETDEEFARRVSADERDKKREEERERKEYERLKLKFTQ